jgi:hypothetical protein
LFASKGCRQICQRCGRQIILQPLSNWLVEVVLSAGHLVVASLHPDDAGVKGLGAFLDFNDGEEGYFVGGSRERKAAAATLGASQNAGAHQFLKDLGEKSRVGDRFL